MNAIIAIVCIAIFLVGLWCYGLAFQIEDDTLQLLTFFAGIMLNTLAVFVPFQVTGRGRRNK